MTRVDPANLFSDKPTDFAFGELFAFLNRFDRRGMPVVKSSELLPDLLQGLALLPVDNEPLDVGCSDRGRPLSAEEWLQMDFPAPFQVSRVSTVRE